MSLKYFVTRIIFSRFQSIELRYFKMFFFPLFIYIIKGVQGGAKNICLGGPSCNTNISIMTSPHTYIYIYTHAFLLYIHTIFYLIIYIYTHPTKKKKKKPQYYFQSKLCLMAIFHKIKFKFSVFIVKFLKNFILNTNYQILY